MPIVMVKNLFIFSNAAFFIRLPFALGNHFSIIVDNNYNA